MADINLERRENETPLEHHKRLLYGKLVDKSLADVDYTEIAEALYGQAYSSDVARRMCYGSKRTIDLVDSQVLNGVKDDSILKGIKRERLELQKERQKFYDQRREYNKLVISDSRREHLYDYLKDVADSLSDDIGIIFPVTSEPHTDISSGNEAVLVFTDWHYGMTASNVFNTYDTNICRERVKKVVEETIQRVELHKCQALHVIILGDLFHGAIHTSARVASEELVCDQIMHVSEILAQSIIELSRHVCMTHVYMTYGNHARTVQSKADSIHRDNMERLIPWWLSQRLKDYESIFVEAQFKDEFLFANVCGHDICAVHGDLDSVKGSPRLLTALFRKQYGKNIEYILLGDKHHRESFDELGVTALICGSLCGTDDYANEKRLYSSPSQTLLIVNDEYGVDAEYYLHC